MRKLDTWQVVDEEGRALVVNATVDHGIEFTVLDDGRCCIAHMDLADAEDLIEFLETEIDNYNNGR